MRVLLDKEKNSNRPESVSKTSADDMLVYGQSVGNRSKGIQTREKEETGSSRSACNLGQQYQSTDSLEEIRPFVQNGHKPKYVPLNQTQQYFEFENQ